nr:TPA: orf y [Tanacetum cinerariifolium]
MLIGANFLRSMKGGIRIEGDEITIYKKVTKIKTSNQTEIAELEVNEEEFLEINESIYFNQEGSKSFLEQFKPVIERLKHQGYIGEEPLKHWKKNGKLYKVDIINPDVTIEDRPLKHVTPAMEDTFKKHVDSLLKIGTIRPCKSRHRTMAMIVNSGTTIDPVTRKEVKGKERMVFNYKSLNDNTYKDQYSLPGINTIIKRIGGAKIFSKFDLKSGFHQVAMDEESIPWTAFLVPGGLYEWLVMPFGLKNAPAATTEYQEAIQATEDIEPPAVGFAKTADYKGGESNLLITMALTGRLSNTSYIGFQYSVENVVDHLTTNGITAIPGERRSIEELEGMSWNLKPPEQTSVRVPSRVAVNERLNRPVSLRFERYRQAPQPPRYSVDQHDREVIGNDNLDEDEEHFVGICTQTPQIEHTPYDSTLGEPSGKWDYYVRYDAPIKTTPIDEIAATGWGEEFSDNEVTREEFSNDEVTPGK